MLTANASPAYSLLDKPVAAAPAVVEFFSFYCPPCYQLVENYPVSKRLNQLLPDGVTVKKYHVSAMGKMGSALSEAWAIASVMGIAEDIEKPLYIAVQQRHAINSVDDIKTLFSTAGITPEQYESARHSVIVKAMVEQQESMAENFSLQGTPTFYVNGRYKINNGAFQAATPEQYVETFAQQVIKLLH
ncbi:DsbA family protein [Erwinia typographi]|nr:DsbA family protein [Erwinia typographi]